MCGSFISKLLPYTPVLIQPTVKEQKILKEVARYNHLNGGGLHCVFRTVLFSARKWLEAVDIKALFGSFLEVLTVTLLPIRWLPPEATEYRRMMLFLSIYTPFNLILGLASQLSFSGFVPSWVGDVAFFTYLFSGAIWTPLIIYLVCDEIWLRLRRHARYCCS